MRLFCFYHRNKTPNDKKKTYRIFHYLLCCLAVPGPNLSIWIDGISHQTSSLHCSFFDPKFTLTLVQLFILLNLFYKIKDETLSFHKQNNNWSNTRQYDPAWDNWLMLNVSNTTVILATVVLCRYPLNFIRPCEECIYLSIITL